MSNVNLQLLDWHYKLNSCRRCSFFSLIEVVTGRVISIEIMETLALRMLITLYNLRMEIDSYFCAMIIYTVYRTTKNIGHNNSQDFS